MSDLLPFEKQALMDILSEDCLTILADGITFERILLNLLKPYLDPGCLVIVVECPDYLETWLLAKLSEVDEIIIPPKIVTSDISTEKREASYMKGGVQFVTSRILIMDILQKRLPVHLITGLVFLNAHRVSDISAEAFIARLFRIENKTGFIKAFSSYVGGFRMGKAESVLKYLFLPKLYLWPRFHVNVSETIDAHPCDVVELLIPLTENTKTLQLCMIDLLHFCLKELKKSVPSIESDMLTMENAVTFDFAKTLKRKLLPIWSTLGEKTTKLFYDIAEISKLNNRLIQYDSVTFYKQVGRLRPAVSLSVQSSSVSMWMFTSSFETLLEQSKKRINIKEKGAPLIELSPKWETMQEVLKEIQDEVKDNKKLNPSVLVFVSRRSTARQISQFVQHGEIEVLKQVLVNSTNRLEAKATPAMFKTTAEIEKEEEELQQNFGLPLTFDIKLFIFDRQNMILDDCLAEINPSFVILFDPDVHLIRGLEMFRCRRANKPLRIYFMMYGSSVEEQRYLTHLKNEKKAFEDLILMKSKMALGVDHNGKAGHNTLLERGPQALTYSENAVESRSGGVQSQNSFPSVVVDMREFRSSLPSILHKSGFELIPCTVEVGDYILTPDLCIERKSINDLIGSLKSGRLFQQAQAMCRSYRYPVLLIEFEESKGFSLQNYSQVTDQVITASLQTQLTLITLQFPKLRMIWSESEYVTSDIFHELKKGKQDPVAADASSVTKDKTLYSSEFNPQTTDLLMSLPGITSKNYFLIARKVKNLEELVGMNVESLTKILGNEETAKNLHAFFNSECSKDKVVAGNSGQGAKSKYAKFEKFRK